MWLNVVEARMTRRLRTLVRMRSGDSGHRPVSTSDQYQPHLTNNKWQYFTKTSEQETFQSFFFSMGWLSSGKPFFRVLWSVPFSAIKRIICMVQPCHSEEWSEKRKPLLVVNRGLESDDRRTFLVTNHVIVWLWDQNSNVKICDELLLLSQQSCFPRFPRTELILFDGLFSQVFSEQKLFAIILSSWITITSTTCLSVNQTNYLAKTNFPDLQSTKNISL